MALPKVVDRSPCGTGTSAKSALLFAEGKLKVGEHFVHESVTGSLFKCEIVEETQIGGVQAVSYTHLDVYKRQCQYALNGL